MPVNLLCYHQSIVNAGNRVIHSTLTEKKLLEVKKALKNDAMVMIKFVLPYATLQSA